MKRRVTYRPGKAQSALGLVMGGIFILIGLFVVIPTFGPFGILWTAMAVGITAVNGYHAFGGKYMGPEIHIEDDQSAGPSAPVDLNAGARLEQLESLRASGLLSEEEYQSKREEILRSL